MQRKYVENLDCDKLFLCEKIEEISYTRYVILSSLACMIIVSVFANSDGKAK